MWRAGAAVKAGFTYGRTDDYSYSLIDSDGRIRGYPGRLIARILANFE